MRRKEIISESSFLGLNIYKRIRNSEIEIEAINNYDKDFLVGLYPLVKYPKLEYDYISLYQQKDWDKTVVELFYKGFMHLLCVKAIKIYSFKDKKSIFGIINFKVNGFYIKTDEPYFTEDIFLNLILKSIKAVNLKYKKKRDLFYNIKFIVDDFLGTSEYSRPEKKFITRLIKRYTRKYNWLELEKESKYLGLVSKYKVRIEESRLLLLNDSFRKLSTISIKEKPSNINLGYFERALTIIVKRDFEGRYPSDTDTD